MLTAEYLKEAITYNPDSGEFIWKIRPRSHFANQNGMNAFNSRRPGKKSGSVNGSGYVIIKLNGVCYGAHRLAWLYMNNEIPSVIDHMNRNRSDNRISNLRNVSTAENLFNAGNRRDNTSGTKGVSWNIVAKKWQARIRIRGKAKNLGFFESLDLAKEARESAEKKLYGYSPCHLTAAEALAIAYRDPNGFMTEEDDGTLF